jgi:lipopolysaccharide export system protein LptA
MVVLVPLLLASVGCAPQFLQRADIEVRDKPAPVLESAPSAPAAPRDLPEVSAQKPIHITADRMSAREKGGITYFEGNVQVKQAKILFQSPHLEWNNSKAEARAWGGIVLEDHLRGTTLTAQEASYQNNLNQGRAWGEVMFLGYDFEGTPLTLRCESLTWDMNRVRLSGQGRVRMDYLEMHATGHQLEYAWLEGIAVLEGYSSDSSARPRVVRGGDSMEGERLRMDLRRSHFILTGDAVVHLEPAPAKQEARHEP